MTDADLDRLIEEGKLHPDMVVAQLGAQAARDIRSLGKALMEWVDKATALQAEVAKLKERYDEDKKIWRQSAELREEVVAEQRAQILSLTGGVLRRRRTGELVKSAADIYQDDCYESGRAAGFAEGKAHGAKWGAIHALDEIDAKAAELVKLRADVRAREAVIMEQGEKIAALLAPKKA